MKNSSAMPNTLIKNPPSVAAINAAADEAFWKQYEDGALDAFRFGIRKGSDEQLLTIFHIGFQWGMKYQREQCAKELERWDTAMTDKLAAEIRRGA